MPASAPSCQAKLAQSLSVGCRPDCFQILLNPPMPRNSNTGCIVERLVVVRAGLVVQDLGGIGILILGANVLVHHQWRQNWPHHSAAEGANLDDVAESLRASLRKCQQLVSELHISADRHGATVSTMGPVRCGRSNT